uniref:Putative antitoxin n=1 Tax=viral metagenome TaxID=1070528 RepID=A0A6M3Y427_9ZZZZ
MSKTIWLKEETKERLDNIRAKGETFDQVVERLIRVYTTLFSVSETLGPSHYLKEHPLGGKTAEENSHR